MRGKGGGARCIFNSSPDFPRALPGARNLDCGSFFIGNRSLVKGLFNGLEREMLHQVREVAFKNSRETDKAARGLEEGIANVMMAHFATVTLS
ncbi:hypothetical protein CEXT_707601 [Caerostris extrusa]|uniref:Uncharacterized protein n=1 Tax=Caerostris extrusa TaxID=172846 RepID=A0AAV4Y7M6_CAEEX|nr:hypothetical protein CEXT_707601 [Caerostris extrusa]